MRRAVALLGAVSALASATPAWGQAPPEVGLLLTKQSAYATVDRPLRISVAARNGTDRPLPDLTLSVAVHSPVRSRSEYAQFLEAGPQTALVARTSSVRGRVGPGALRRLPSMELGLRDLGAIGESGLYPVTVELQSAGLPVASLSSVVVFIDEEPLTPLLVSLSFVLDAPIRVRPDGTFVDDALERQVEPGGRLDAMISALEEVPGLDVTVVVSPVLLEELQDMRDGYRIAEDGPVREVPADAAPAVSAGQLLDRTREVARQPNVQVIALPYASPSVPALVHADLEADLTRQIRRGREAVAAMLGKDPHPAVFRPPGSALTASSLPPLAAALAAELGTQPALLLDGDVLPPPPPDPLTPPATAEVEVNGTSLLAVGSDPVLEERARSLPDDPILRAHHTVGELSAIYFEQPGLSRGTALVFGEGDAPQAGFLRTLLRGIRGAPGAAWLRAVTASRLLEGDVLPPDRPRDRRELAEAVRPSPLAGSFASELADSRDAVEALDSMAEQPDLIANLDRLLLLSESRYLTGDQDLRLAYLDSARATVREEFDKVHLPSSSSITLTSRTGRIPVTLRNDAGYPIDLVLSLRAPGLELIGGPTRDITLTRPIQTFVFPARAQRTGRFPAELRLATRDGTPVGSTEIVVRSTAYNRIALVVTIGAALFLAVWWGRRFLSRTTA